ncbi:hypothetical protein IT568_05960 [bacterium]|nr:hypothetical protein [bacterium]
MKIYFFTEDKTSQKVTQKFIELALEFLGQEQAEFEEIFKDVLGSDIFNQTKLNDFIQYALATLKTEKDCIFCFHIDADEKFNNFQIFITNNKIILKIRKNIKNRFAEMIPCSAIENWCCANKKELSNKLSEIETSSQKKLEQVLSSESYLEKLDEIGKIKFAGSGEKNTKIMLGLVADGFPTQNFYNVKKSFYCFAENLKLALAQKKIIL